MNIHAFVHPRFKCSVKHFLKDRTWYLPHEIHARVGNQIGNIDIPLCELEDTLVWESTPNGDFLFKDAYLFLKQPISKLNWTKIIWNKHVPPSKSFVLWRLLHGKILTEDQLRRKGVIITLVCSHCYNDLETSKHLFCECPFALQLWEWLSRLMDVTLNTSNILEILQKPWSKFAKLIILSSITFTIDEIWNNRNMIKFHNCSNRLEYLKNKIITLVNSCSSITQLPMNNNIKELKLLKSFLLPCRIRKLEQPVEIRWTPLSIGWIKCNTDGAFSSFTSSTSCGVIFRDSSANLVGYLAESVGGKSTLEAEVLAIIYAV
uniref:Ribonuclease H protein At1g65750 family n=1 Tax=Cajanus cajan TaxID=3821 RepID=A0A151QMK6_CAJCA|nr:Putative ribonuclease H protein At1g65750 family [Cajanus cajan]